MNDNPQPKVSIIILNWNNVGETLALLDNLKAIEYPNYQVLVVDNASKDDSVGQLARYIEQLRRANDEFARRLAIMPLSKNFGYAEGNNKGVSQASRDKPDYYLLLNNDTIISPDCISRLVTAAEADSQLGAVGPTIYFASPTGQRSQRVWYAGGWLNFMAGGAHHKTVLPSAKPPANDYWPTEFITGCCLLIRREVLAKLGQLFDPQFFAYNEDVDLSIRLTRAGYQLGYVPAAKLWHKLAVSSGGPKSYNFWYYNVRNNFFIMRRYASWWQWPIYLLYFIFYKPLLWSVAGAIGRPRGDKFYRLIAIAHGSYDALRGHGGQRSG